MRRRTYDETIIIPGSSLLLAASYERRLIPGWTTRGSWEMLEKYALNTPAVNLELARIMSAFPGVCQ
jgi:hypothetical protein